MKDTVKGLKDLQLARVISEVEKLTDVDAYFNKLAGKYTTDNPTLFSIVALRTEFAEWAGTDVPQEVERVGNGWVTSNTKISAVGSLLAPERGTNLDAIEAIPENNGVWTAPDVVPLRYDGLRLGYRPADRKSVV